MEKHTRANLTADRLNTLSQSGLLSFVEQVSLTIIFIHIKIILIMHGRYRQRHQAKKITIQRIGQASEDCEQAEVKTTTSCHLPCMTDVNESITYCKAIKKSQLSRSLSVPSSINKCIAEFATGQIIPCATESCTRTTCELRGDFIVLGEHGRCGQCGEWRCEHHDIDVECETAKHAACCSLIGSCADCGIPACSKCDLEREAHDGNYETMLYCVECELIVCAECFDKPGWGHNWCWDCYGPWCCEDCVVYPDECGCDVYWYDL